MKFSTIIAFVTVCGVSSAAREGSSIRSGVAMKDTTTTGSTKKTRVGAISITLDGLNHGVSGNEIAFISDGIETAFNAVFFDSVGSKLKFAMIKADRAESIELGSGRWGCRLCPTPDDDGYLLGTEDDTDLSQVIHARLGVDAGRWGCRLCPKPDDDSYAMSDNEFELLQVAFEKAVCDIVRSSGFENIANVAGCSVTYNENLQMSEG